MNYKGYYAIMEVPLETRIELEKKVLRFCKENNFSAVDDTVTSLKILGFDVLTVPFRNNIEGMILVDETEKKLKGFSSNKIIAVSNQLTLQLSRFVLMHELAHYIQKKSEMQGNSKQGFYLAARDHQAKYSTDIKEQENDYIAAILLLPTENLKGYASRYLQQEKSVNVDDSNYWEEFKALEDNEGFLDLIQKDFRVDKELEKRRIGEVEEISKNGQANK